MTPFERGFLKQAAEAGVSQEEANRLFDTLTQRPRVMSAAVGGGLMGGVGGAGLGAGLGYHLGKDEKDPSKDNRWMGAMLGGAGGGLLGAGAMGYGSAAKEWSNIKAPLLAGLDKQVQSLRDFKPAWGTGWADSLVGGQAIRDGAIKHLEQAVQPVRDSSAMDVLLRRP